MIEKTLNKSIGNEIAGLSPELQARLEIGDGFKEKVVTKVLNWGNIAYWDNIPHTGNISFEDSYKAGLGRSKDPITNFINKYKIAKVLIEDGRYEKRKFLVQNFIPEGNGLDAEALAVAKQLKGHLSLLLVKTGDVSTTTASEEEQDAAAYLKNKFEHSKAMEDFIRNGMSAAEIGQIITLEECSEMTDEKKLEEFRSWATHTFLRSHLGMLTGTRPERDLTVVELVDRLPRQVFTHPYAIRYNLIQNFFAKEMRQLVTDIGAEEAIRTMETAIEKVDDPEQKQFLDRVYERVYDTITYPYQGDFKETIRVKGKERIFPSVEQETVCYDSIHFDTRLFVAAPGLGKTGGGYFIAENSEAEEFLVVAPASVRPVWKEQDIVVFNNPGNVFLIEDSADIAKALTFPRNYLVVSKELLGRSDIDPALLPSLIDLVTSRRTDGSIIDEIHNFTNPNAASTRALRRLLEVIRQNYLEKTGKTNAFTLGLTATPLHKAISDLDVPMALLYPDEFAATPMESTETRKTFSDRCLRNPHITYLALIGEKRMFRWESGDRGFDCETLPIKASPFEELLADFINSELGGDALNKIRLIENAFFNPLLVKNEVRRLAKGAIPRVDIDEAVEVLRTTLSEWKKMKGIDTPLSDDDYLSVDRLVELGLDKIVLGCFFSNLPHGIDTLVEELSKDNLDPDSADLRHFWKSREISTKYTILRQLIEESLTWRIGEDGSLGREKIIIISPARKQGRTGDVLQKECKDGNGKTTELYTEDDLGRINDIKLLSMIKQWVKEKGLCRPEDVLLIDGTVHVGKKRDAVISKFTNDPDTAVLSVTLEATYQGRDFTLNNIIDEHGRRIIGVHNIFLGPTWDGRERKQMIGRSVRQEHLVPVRSTVLEILDSVEQGKGEAVRFSDLLEGIAISGAAIHPDDQAFMDSKRIGSRILRYRNSESNFLRDAFSRVKGVGEDETVEIMGATPNRQERTNFQIFAERFYDEGRDEYKTTGYNAELVASLIRNNSEAESSVLSLGAGTLLLQRKLRRGVVNVDLNPYMMEAGWQSAHDFGGRIITNRASCLDPQEFKNESHTSVDSAFALDWSRLGNTRENDVENSERVKILSQVNRVLIDGGTFYLTLPEGTLDEERLEGVINALENSFGFQVDRSHTGKSYGISRFGTTKRLGWCIVARKAGQLNLSTLNLENLEFCTDSRRWESNYKEKQNGSEKPDREYPTPGVRLHFSRYEIENSSGERVEVDVAGSYVEDKPEATPITIDFLKGETLDDFETYRKKLLRPLIRITGLNWTEAEKHVISLLQDVIKASRSPRDRAAAYSWILKEAKRRK